MHRALLLLLGALLLLTPPDPLEAQSGANAWTFVSGRTSTSVPISTARGYPALPASALIGMGAQVAASPGEVRLRLAGGEASVSPGSPFVKIGDALKQLVNPVYEEGGVVYLPIQFVVEHLPLLLGSTADIDPVARTVRGGSVALPQEPGTAARASTPAAALSAGSPEPAAERANDPPAAAASAPSMSPAPAPRSGAARRLVVIDPGHGGVDPGARGPGGTREKDITLGVSRRLAALLREDTSLEVRMTRDRDTLIALTDRTRMANRWKGEEREALFMSIHTNAHTRSSVRGFETFFLSDAKTEDARRVAEMENAAQQYESPETKLDPLSFIMHDLRQNKYLRDSSEWAAMVQTRLGAIHPGPNRGVKQAGFVVLNGAFMPAVLVELGFISHPQEERMLRDAAYQDRMARQLARAVQDFFTQSTARAAARE